MSEIKIKKKYINLYYNTSTSNIVTGINSYNTKQAARKNIKCPNSYVHLDVATLKIQEDEH